MTTAFGKVFNNEVLDTAQVAFLSLVSTGGLVKFCVPLLVLGLLWPLSVGCGPSRITLEDLEAAAAIAGPSDIVIDVQARPKALLNLEKANVKLGFIKLTDCAPLVIAKEKGFFEDEGLNVELEAQSNWKVIELSMGSWMGRICWPANPLAPPSALAPRRT